MNPCGYRVIRPLSLHPGSGYRGRLSGPLLDRIDVLLGNHREDNWLQRR
jgi:predicted ATPase with chaperone activity